MASTANSTIWQPSSLERDLETRFDTVFEQSRPEPLLTFARLRMPPIAPEVSPAPEAVESAVTPAAAEPGQAERIELAAGKVRLAVNRELGIRLYYDEQQVTTDRESIPVDYPWFSPDPADPADIAGYAAKHVARGSRADTWPEDQWPLVNGVKQGEQNWPPREVAFGPYHLSQGQDAEGQAILVTLPPDAQGNIQPNAYGVIPKGIFAITPTQSVVMAWQNENRSDKGLHWAAWFILGFAMPRVNPSYTDPAVIFAFPDDESDDAPTNRMSKIWNYYDVQGQKLALINPHVKTLNEPFKKFLRNTNWSIVAEKGKPYIILTRSVLRHEEQFFPFLEHGRYFIEAEHTGRRAAPGEKSTVIIQHDFVPVDFLTNGKTTRLSEEKERFQEEVLLSLQNLVSLDQAQQLVLAQS